MRAYFATSLAVLCWVGSAGGQEGRWITFKTGHNSWGRIEHQIDAQSVQPEGPYKMFWTRVWIVNRRQPLMFTLNEALFALSQKYMVDCAGRRIGDHFVDSNDPAESKHKTPLAAMHWETFDKTSAIDRAVCGKAR
jgi:hypothetical protein